MYPNMESKVNAQLAKTGTFFQSYIRRGLANLEAEAAAAARGGNNSNSFGNNSPLNNGTVPGLGPSSSQGIGGMTSLSRSPTPSFDAGIRKRESILSVTSSTEGLSNSTVDGASESYKDRLARLQQMFNYKTVGFFFLK